MTRNISLKRVKSKGQKILKRDASPQYTTTTVVSDQPVGRPNVTSVTRVICQVRSTVGIKDKEERSDKGSPQRATLREQRDTDTDKTNIPGELSVADTTKASSPKRSTLREQRDKDANIADERSVSENSKTPSLLGATRREQRDKDVDKKTIPGERSVADNSKTPSPKRATPREQRDKDTEKTNKLDERSAAGTSKAATTENDPVERYIAQAITAESQTDLKCPLSNIKTGEAHSLDVSLLGDDSLSCITNSRRITSPNEMLIHKSPSSATSTQKNLSLAPSVENKSISSPSPAVDCISGNVELVPGSPRNKHPESKHESTAISVTSDASRKRQIVDLEDLKKLFGMHLVGAQGQVHGRCVRCGIETYRLVERPSQNGAWGQSTLVSEAITNSVVFKGRCLLCFPCPPGITDAREVSSESETRTANSDRRSQRRSQRRSSSLRRKSRSKSKSRSMSTKRRFEVLPDDDTLDTGTADDCTYTDFTDESTLYTIFTEPEKPAPLCGSFKSFCCGAGLD
eukprot:11119912-Ditylum_brightwellii.AAC.1